MDWLKGLFKTTQRISVSQGVNRVIQGEGLCLIQVCYRRFSKISVRSRAGSLIYSVETDNMRADR